MSKIRILSIDGGGIMGIIPGQVLVKLEEKLQKRSGDASLRIADCVDMIAGTSTGGILAALLLYPGPNGRAKYSAKEAVSLYKKFGGDIFHASTLWKIKTLGGLIGPKYPVKGLETVLKDFLGDTPLKSLLKPCLITSYNMEERYVHFFRSYRAAKAPSYDFPLWEVCRATSAAPTYFAAMKAKAMDGSVYPLVDGGVVANNPAVCAYIEGRTQFDVTAENSVLLSLGTGYSLKSYSYSKIARCGIVSWARPLVDILLSGGPDVAEFAADQLYKSAGVSHQYLRVNVDLAELDDVADIHVSPELDDVDISNIEQIGRAGTWLADKFSLKLDVIVDQLLDIELSDKKKKDMES